MSKKTNQEVLVLIAGCRRVAFNLIFSFCTVSAMSSSDVRRMRETKLEGALLYDVRHMKRYRRLFEYMSRQ